MQISSVLSIISAAAKAFSSEAMEYSMAQSTNNTLENNKINNHVNLFGDGWVVLSSDTANAVFAFQKNGKGNHPPTSGQSSFDLHSDKQLFTTDSKDVPLAAISSSTENYYYLSTSLASNAIASTLTWDLNDDTSVTAYLNGEPLFFYGNWVGGESTALLTMSTDAPGIGQYAQPIYWQYS